MKLNRQFQDLHTEAKSADWVLKQQLERDICLLYHQLANYSFIMGDLYYGDVFGLPYWEHLEMHGVEPDDRAFIRDGCLVMMLCMASECIDGSGSYVREHVPACLAALDGLSLPGGETQRLIAAVRTALELVERGGPEPPELFAEYTWVHERYVRRYFTDQADDFRTNPYFATGAT
ncbi:MAG: hypothetical protein IPM79_37370 [Polyangiaceae bacterium]|nr:hypothetical protein [Polyangiaceae bacterium]